MIFHYHITLRDVTASQALRAAALTKSRVTYIDLIGDNLAHPKHRILTRYSNGFKKMFNLLRIDAETLRQAGFTLDRLKIDRNLSKTEFDSKMRLRSSKTYEVHAKVDQAVKNITLFQGRLSKNPIHDQHFVDFKLDLSNAMDVAGYVSDMAEIEKAGVLIQPPYYEMIGFDTNPELDSDWWKG